MVRLPIYLDHNATTPCDPQVLEAMLPYFSRFYGNAASTHHSFGWQASAAVELAREQVAALIGAQPKEIIFTSGATESDNLALKGVFDRYRSKGNHIITVTTEHRAVLDTCQQLEKQGAEITYLPVDVDGLISLPALELAIRPTTILIAVMYANNETGVLQQVREISRIARDHQVIFFSDATQALGKVPINVEADGIDLMSCSAHKIYGPKGVGALYVRRKNPRVSLTAQMDGGGHELGIRSGTLNVPGIVGFGKACAICAELMAEESIRTCGLRDKLEHALLELDGAHLNGSRGGRLPQISNISFPGTSSDQLLLAVQADIALSAGSACMSGSLEPSYVLMAQGLGEELARCSLRFGLGRNTTEEEINFTIERITAAVEARKMEITN